MQRKFVHQMLVGAATILIAASCAKDSKPVAEDPAAAGERYMRAMSDALAHSAAFAFETTEAIELIGPDGAKRTLQFNRKLTARRPDAVYFEVREGTVNGIAASAHYDGRVVSLSSAADKVWAQTEVPNTLDAMLDDVALRFSLPVPVGDVLYSSPYDAFLGKKSKGGLVGRETLDGVPCVKLDYDDTIMEVRLWIPAEGKPLPRRVELVYERAPGKPSSRLDFTNWSLDVPAADTLFAFQPPDGYRQIEFADFAAGLLSGTVVPGLEKETK